MINQNLTAELNQQQLAAVTATNNYTLIFAGAGSGKTKVLVHRCAWVMQNEQLHSSEILAVTFTNKAAKEMQNRIGQLIDQPLYSMWCGTFHGLCHRILKQHHSAINLPENFQIIDQDDQQKLIKKIQKTMQLDESKWPVKKTQSIINSLKEQGKRARDCQQQENQQQQMIQTIYQQYESICKQEGWVDFAEILLLTVELLDSSPAIQDYYNQQFKHILIDEFQDTNSLQYKWLCQMAGKTAKITAVGDDDQSIYSWRGAKVGNLIKFTKEFANTLTIRLEQNYRSTATILNAANGVIQNNKNRMGKTLWTEKNTGENIDLYQAFNEFDEAQYICQQIGIYQQQGISLDEIAVLYRSNAQSRLLEDRFTRANLAYKIHGGLRFFDRAEIKDALGYLRLIARKNDDAAFERIINTPARGIGHATMVHIRELAKKNNTCLWDSAQSHLTQNILSKRALDAVKKFLHLIEELTEDSKNGTLTETCTSIVEKSGLMLSLTTNDNKNSSKIDNLEELINATRNYNENDNEPVSLDNFLNNIILEQTAQTDQEHQEKTQLMTLHASKGLEFNYIFLIGLEEGLFPHKMCLHDNQQIEEERRLCYVGMTRAMKKLHISYAESRRSSGSTTIQQPSRFILEIPKEILTPIKISNYNNQYNQSSETAPAQTTGTKIQLGQKVMHKYFGEGTVLNCDGNDDSTRVQIVFKAHGVKWLILKQSPLTIL